MFQFRYFLLLAITLSILACSKPDCEDTVLGPCIECEDRILNTCTISLFPEFSDQYTMKTSNGDIIEFNTSHHNLDTAISTRGELARCIIHKSLNVRVRGGYNHIVLDYKKTTLFGKPEFDFRVSYHDSLSTFRGPFRDAYYFPIFQWDCTISERHYTDSVIVNNTVYRDVYKVEENYWDDPDPIYQTKPRFRYIYFTKFGELLKFESETESFELLN